MKVGGKEYRAVWMNGSRVMAINQPLLPHRFEVTSFETHRDTAEAIRAMIVRGAGTIGAAAGFALAQAAWEAPERGCRQYIAAAYARILKTRPTAADLKHALDRVMSSINPLLQNSKTPSLPSIRRAAIAEAQKISDDYSRAGERIAKLGLRLLKPRKSRDGMVRVLTHCNAGWLALQDWGSAPAPIYLAHRRGKKVFVWVDETRPRNQGANLTSWELLQEGVPHAVIADNAGGYFMRNGEVDLVITGADRIAANGDTANKIGTYQHAVLARENGIPFYIAAPVSTIDLSCLDGDHIPIEERSEEEVHYISGKKSPFPASTEACRGQGDLVRVRITPNGARARNPAFDITPARYITAILTDRGIVQPNRRALAAIFRK